MYNPLVGTTGVAAYTSAASGGNVEGESISGAFVIDGTPVRVAALALSAALSIAALKWAGFRFNVGV